MKTHNPSANTTKIQTQCAPTAIERQRQSTTRATTSTQNAKGTKATRSIASSVQRSTSYQKSSVRSNKHLPDRTTPSLHDHYHPDHSHTHQPKTVNANLITDDISDVIAKSDPHPAVQRAICDRLALTVLAQGKLQSQCREALLNSLKHILPSDTRWCIK